MTICLFVAYFYGAADNESKFNDRVAEKNVRSLYQVFKECAKEEKYTVKYQNWEADTTKFYELKCSELSEVPDWRTTNLSLFWDEEI